MLFLGYGRLCDPAATSSTSSSSLTCPDSLHRQSVDFPVVRQRRVPTVQTVQLTAEILQVLPVLNMLRQVPAVLLEQWRCLRLSSLSVVNRDRYPQQFQFLTRLCACPGCATTGFVARVCSTSTRSLVCQCHAEASSSVGGCLRRLFDKFLMFST